MIQENNPLRGDEKAQGALYVREPRGTKHPLSRLELASVSCVIYDEVAIERLETVPIMLQPKVASPWPVKN